MLQARCANRPGDHAIYLNLDFEVGKYLISPLSSLLDDGKYTSALSIRSGRGIATRVRVMRFPKRFSTRRAALSYAVDYGRRWGRGDA